MTKTDDKTQKTSDTNIKTSSSSTSKTVIRNPPLRGRSDAPSASKEKVHSAPHIRSGRRGIRRGVYFRGFVWDFVVSFAKEARISVSSVVNKALELFLSERLEGAPQQVFLLESRREQLLAEERSLRERLRVILRSGAFLKDYAKELLLGDEKQIFNLKRRVGVYAHVKPKELNIILRILKRREDLVNELLEIEDKLLPSTMYPFMVTEQGWKIGDSIIARDRRRRQSPTRKTGQSENKTGGEHKRE